MARPDDSKNKNAKSERASSRSPRLRERSTKSSIDYDKLGLFEDIDETKHQSSSSKENSDEPRVRGSKRHETSEPKVRGSKRRELEEARSRSEVSPRRRDRREEEFYNEDNPLDRKIASAKKREDEQNAEINEKKEAQKDAILDFCQILFGAVFNSLLTFGIIFVAYNFITSSFTFGKDYAFAITEEKEGVEIVVQIPNGATVREAAQILQDEGVVISAILYEMEQLLRSSTSPYDGGEYTLNTAMESVDINRTLRYGNSDNTDQKITIPEGYTINDMGNSLEAANVVTYDEFLETSNVSDFSYDFLADIPNKENPLEGYLFPDTYFLTANANSREIISKMLSRFEDIYFDDTINVLAIEKGLSMHEVITMASIIEKEAPNEADRYKMSALLHNRIANEMPLEMKSILAYGLEKSRSDLTAADYDVSSGYNVFINSGLPTGPITNPGRDSIIAVLYPEEGANYLYYLITDTVNNTYVFTNTREEYEQALIDMTLAE